MEFQKSLSLENMKILQNGYVSVNFMEIKIGNNLEILKLKVSTEKQGQNRGKKIMQRLGVCLTVLRSQNSFLKHCLKSQKVHITK